MDVHMYIYIYMDVHVYIYIHMYIYVHIFMYSYRLYKSSLNKNRFWKGP